MKTSTNTDIGGNIARLRVRIAQLMGADINEILTHLDITLDELENPERYLDAEFDNRVWQVIEQQTQNELAGASMGPFLQLSSMGLVGQAIMACETIHQGLRSYVRYSQLLPLRDKVALIEQDQQLIFQIELSNRLLPFSHHGISSFLRFVISGLEQLSGQKIAIKQMGFVFDAPNNSALLERYQQIFNTDNVLFSQKNNWFSLDNRYKNIKNLAASKSDFEVIDQLINQSNANHGRKPAVDFGNQVQNYIRRHLGHSDISLKKVAQHFSISERKLQNQLAHQQQTYSKLLSKVRQDYALELIAEEHLSVTDIAYLLGYQDINSFSRHFKKWYGISASQYRHSSSRQ